MCNNNKKKLKTSRSGEIFINRNGCSGCLIFGIQWTHTLWKKAVRFVGHREEESQRKKKLLFEKSAINVATNPKTINQNQVQTNDRLQLIVIRNINDISVKDYAL